MIKLIVGKKGFGKTKTLIDLVNQAVKENEGSVACIEKGVKLTYDISHKARLVNTEEFGVDNYESLYGFVAGMIGILATLGLNMIINMVLFHFTQIAALKAALPIGGAIVLVAISMMLTLIAGLFPAGIAAKKNPVEALRSE